ncbi:nucleotide sugar dehydrogenase [Marinoscillum sp. 108]|uniref:nucleotide sugar dehydrogenase n=1 Tax=Marinoscillum sp. 108 TaxID=2653151 RepID=UPI0012EF4453|nr:nucleotide sugar dehydrogenase [Marinoscillum sp. 108]VXD19074.1 putative UDP-glucose/GDP-mannose dehydrogenase [Marinoscillum sp. 108]
MEFKIAVIGLGYVGLPLAVESGRKYKTIGFDINTTRISELKAGTDRTQEVDKEDLLGAKHLTFSSEPSALSDCNFYIVTVPTPVDQHKKPDLSPIISASRMISSLLKKGDIVVYESTVYPGCTEEICVPELEKSGLVFNEDFFCGYSPERINPGDKVHRLTTILKVTSGSNPEAAETVDHFYKSIVTAGTYKASSIKVAEAAKVIENSQRDINIAFVNELSLIFDRVGIDTQEVLEAAGTKWNFLKFTPGLVGGHCIGVDPFYLTYKAEELGYHPQVILSGRKINDNMGAYVAQRTIKLLSQKKKLSQQTKVLILGITFKENCPDIRNSRVIDIYRELVDFGVDTDVFDPNADQVEVSVEYGINMLNEPVYSSYEAIILAVAHGQFLELDWSSIRNNISVIFDVKGLLPKEFVDSRL